MKIIPFENLVTTEWAGGTTTQLFIFPENAKYKELNFDFRISTATIEIEHSVFTKLPGVKRTLMVLDGTLELVHKDQHSTILEKYEKDHFDGDWETQSGGIAEDFNLMVLNPNLTGYLRHLQIGKKKSIQLTTEKHGFIFIHRGTIDLNNEMQLTNGDSIHFTEKDVITVTGISNAILIYVIIE